MSKYVVTSTKTTSMLFKIVYKQTWILLGFADCFTKKWNWICE